MQLTASQIELLNLAVSEFIRSKENKVNSFIVIRDKENQKIGLKKLCTAFIGIHTKEINELKELLKLIENE